MRTMYKSNLKFEIFKLSLMFSSTFLNLYCGCQVLEFSSSCWASGGLSVDFRIANGSDAKNRDGL
jgi:hypothetical protein